MAKSEVKREYIDVDPSELSQAVQDAVAEEKRIYGLLKAQRAVVLESIRAEVPAPDGHEIAGTHWTRWGQFQISIAEKAKPKAATGRRESLTGYLARLQAEGRAH